MSETKRSPDAIRLAFPFYTQPNSDGGHAIFNQRDERLGVFGDSETALLFLTAVNAHEAFKKACEDVVARYEKASEQSCEELCWEEFADVGELYDALALAEGTP